MAIGVSGLPSVFDRTIFTNKGPIAKPPLPLLQGSNLSVISPTDVRIPTGSFDSTAEGMFLTISGSPGGRNDGNFTIDRTLSSTTLRLKNANFSTADIALITLFLIDLANDLRVVFNLHRISDGIHHLNDTVNVVSAPLASDLASAIVLLNAVRASYEAHIANTGGNFHLTPDILNVCYLPDAYNLPGAVLLANNLRRQYEAHRTARLNHVKPDLIDAVSSPDVETPDGGFLVGPFDWVYGDPRYGMAADDPSDVVVTIDGNPAAVEAVFGLLGAIVMAVKPTHGSAISVDYDWLENPPSRFLRLNSPEFNLNQAGNTGRCGFPEHSYRARSYLVDPGHSPDFMTPYGPKKTGWKYKGYERLYTKTLNDPNTLLTNVPLNKIKYPVLFKTLEEVTVRYDPSSLPQNSSDPWTLEGDGQFTLKPGGGLLTIVDSSLSTGPQSRPPFFSHELDLGAPVLISLSFRASVISSIPDGVFSGVACGVSDGLRAIVCGFITTNATNLTSAIVMLNSIKSSFNQHLSSVGVHLPNDSADAILIVDSHDLPSLVILANNIKKLLNLHIAKGGVGGVHLIHDTTNTITVSDADDLPSALLLINQIRTSFNSHRTQTGIHFLNDTINVVNQVKQIGILTNLQNGIYELEENWVAAAADWSIIRSYRLFRDENGNVSLFFAGDPNPSIVLDARGLPHISDIDGKFDPIQQVFFGSIGRSTGSTSQWAFVRTNVIPIDANLIGGNKSVAYNATGTPEKDTNPWISIGMGGHEKISAGVLLLDSTCSTPPNNVEALGLSSGAYRGFVRLEPSLSENTTCVLEFRFAGDWYSNGINEDACSVIIDDGSLLVQLAFLQYSPSRASITGSAVEPFTIVLDDSMKMSLGDDPEFTVTFQNGDNSASTVSSRINTAAGATVATAENGAVKITSTDSGMEATFSILSGNALAKLGFSPGPYFGQDSSPEPRVSWFAENFPDLDTPTWTASGDQPVEMLGRVLSINDSSTSSYKFYNLSDAFVTNQAINPITDWKLNFRIAVESFTVGDAVPSGSFADLNFAGVLVSLDEGPGGRNAEIHLAKDSGGNPFINLLSYNPTSGALDVIAQYPFAWTDKQIHAYDLYTSKTNDFLLLSVDGVFLTPSPPTVINYTSLNPGSSGPSISFGSGSGSSVGFDPSTAKSQTLWYSVSVIRDSKLADTDAANRRFVGIYTGGDASSLESYALLQIDWTSSHVYRIVRDPSTAVSVFLDGGFTPVITVPYDSLRLPPSSASPMNGMTSGHSSVAFGSFNPQELFRSRWSYLNYSLGRMTNTNLLVPSYQALNRANVVASPDHLFTQKLHTHAGFSVYSGGTPMDDFMSDPGVVPYTILGDGTPPIPMTQNLESRGGLQKNATRVEDVAVANLVNFPGYLANTIDDHENNLDNTRSPTVSTAISQLVSESNNFQSRFNSHLTDVGVHPVDDTVNTSLAPTATDEASALFMLTDLKNSFNAHLTEASVHVQNGINFITSSDPTDLTSAGIIIQELSTAFIVHFSYGQIHVADDGNPVTSPNATNIISALVLIDDLRIRYADHVVNQTYHMTADLIDSAPLGRIPGLGHASPNGATLVSGSDILVAVGDTIQFHSGANAGVPVTVLSVIDSTSFTVSSTLAFTTPAPFTKMVGGQPVVSQDSVFKLTVDLVHRFNLHRVRKNVHPVNDTVNATTISNPPFTLANLFAYMNDFKVEYNLHLDGEVVHLSASSATPVFFTDPLTVSIQIANSIKFRLNAHLVDLAAAAGISPSGEGTSIGAYHVTRDPSSQILVPDASDLASLIVLLNATKLNFNSHIIKARIHAGSAGTDSVSSANASDLVSAVTLVNEIHDKYELHRMRPGVHGAAILIHIDPPSNHALGVLYEGMKFYPTPTDKGQTYPLSDDETWYMNLGTTSLDAYSAPQTTNARPFIIGPPGGSAPAKFPPIISASYAPVLNSPVYALINTAPQVVGTMTDSISGEVTIILF